MNLTAHLFEKQKVLVIYGTEYPFDSIVDFKVNDNQSYKVVTSTSSMIGRGLVGEVLLGGTGAIVGANTASKNVSSDTTTYKICITLNDLSDPLIEYCTTDGAKANKLISILKIIIDRNDLKRKRRN